MAERDRLAHEELDRLIDEGGPSADTRLAELLATAGSVRESLAAPVVPPAPSSQVAAALAAAHRRAVRIRLLTLTLALIAAVVVAGTLGSGEQGGKPTGADRGQQQAPGSSGTRERGDSDRGADNGRGDRGVRQSPSLEGYSSVKGGVLEVLGSDRPDGR